MSGVPPTSTPTKQMVDIEIPTAIWAEIQLRATQTGRDPAGLAAELLSEALRMRRVPGIVFADESPGRRARIEGTGIEVFEVISSYRAMQQEWDGLRKAFHWLSERQLRAALAYAEAYPDEIEARLRAEEAWTPERVWTKYPFMRPPQR